MLKVLLEMRPALAGHAGIPQATRLLFKGLSGLPGFDVEGLLQSSNRVVGRGLPVDPRKTLPEHRRIDRLSRVVISLQPDEDLSIPQRGVAMLNVARHSLQSLAGRALGMQQTLTRFESRGFEDFVWRHLFSRTLDTADIELVTRARHRIARMPWSALHATALMTRRFGHAVYPRFDTTGFDVMVAQTPYPARISPSTRMVVHYHDAIPLLMPHTIADKAYHQASHYHALKRNIADKAWFACVSESTRRDLVRIFPEAEPRTVTIHNMISEHYRREDGGAERVAEVLRTREHPKLAGSSDVPMARFAARAGGAPIDYLLMVSTLEPRKNHVGLLGAWERLRSQGFGHLRLVFVGSLGWHHKGIVQKLKPWLARGGLHVLEDVPADELRLLYRHARVTVCPSFGEGFDFSGVEAMRCGGVVAASDIPVHRDIFGAAADYFSPYSSAQMAEAIAALMGPEAEGRRTALREEGERVSAAYVPSRILPQWERFLAGLKTGPEPRL